MRSHSTRTARRRTDRWAAALVCLALLAAAEPARALNFNEEIPGLTVTPFVSERFEYETNVFQTPTNAKASLITRTTPGILIELGRSTLQLAFGYRAELVEYYQVSGQDTTNNSFVAQMKVQTPKLMVAFRDDYIQSNVPPSSEQTGPVQSTTNTLAPVAEYRLTDRFSIGANYTWTHVNYPPATSTSSSSEPATQTEQNVAVQQLNRDDQLGGLTLFWKFLPKADIGIGYQYGASTFSSAAERNMTVQILSAQLRGDVTSKLYSTFRLGIIHRETDGNAAPPYTGLIVGGGWVYKLTERTIFSLDTSRSVQDSIFENAQYFVATAATLGVKQEFTPKLFGLLKIALGSNLYTTKQEVDTRVKWRVDDLLGGSLGLDYELRPWLRLGLDYTLQKRRSNFSEFNYDDNKISGRITVQF